MSYTCPSPTLLRYIRASDRLQKKSRISRDLQGQICGNFRGKLRRKAICKKTVDFVIIFGQISLEINHFCADQTSVFNIFLTEVRHYFAVSTTICSRNEPMAKPLTSWLKPSFSQHNLCLVVLGRCLHVSVTTFQDKFASLRQVNSPNS